MTRKRYKTLDEKYMGTEPSWEDIDDTMAEYELTAKIESAIRWYSYFYDFKESLKFVDQFYRKQKVDRTNLKKITTMDRAIAGVEWLNKYLYKSDYEVFSEVIVYCKELKIAGTVDLLVFDKVNNKYSILDWKTSKEIKTDSYKMKTGNKPETHDLLDCKFNHYALLLSLYRYLLEKNYNIVLDDQLIIHLETNNVHGYLTPYFKEHIVSILKHY